MARMVKGIMATALVASLVASSAMAVDYKKKTPVSGFNMDTFNASQLQGLASLQNLSAMNGLMGANIGNMNLGEMLAASVVSGLMSGSPIDMQMLGQIGGVAVAGMMQQGLGGNLGGLTGGLGGIGGGLGGIGGGLGGLGGLANFGGLEGIATAALGQVLNQAVQQVMGGIQGGSSGGGGGGGSNTDNFGGSFTSGGVTIGGGIPVTDEAPVISKNAPIVETSVNYKAGEYDAFKGNTPDERFKFADDQSYDTNYWAGYQEALLLMAAKD